jgi:oligopeptide/dipeptide ABC transporter ATP-binding protein
MATTSWPGGAPPPPPAPGGAPPPPRDGDDLLRIEGLRTYFDTYDGTVRAVDGVDLAIRRGETLGLVGESGSGKSITALSVLRLVPMPPGRFAGGRVLFQGKDLLRADARAMAKLRGGAISMIFQEPMTSLNPVFRVGDQVAETILLHQDLGEPLTLPDRLLQRLRVRTRRVKEREELARAQAVRMLKVTGIPDPARVARMYPHELSGGMRQRVMIAMALSCNPELLIADEPTTALDVTIQAQIMELMRDAKRRFGSAVLLITHHLGVVAEFCQRVAVMYAGRIVEEAGTRDLFHQPLHPYTQGLMASIPDPGKGRKEELATIRGGVPDMRAPPAGCRFHPRCPFVMDVCVRYDPALVDVGNGHKVACFLHHRKHLPAREGRA